MSDDKKKKKKGDKPVWKEAVDPNTGRKFWYNRETKQSTWDNPLGDEAEAAPVEEKKEKKKKAKAEAEEEAPASKPSKSKSKKGGAAKSLEDWCQIIADEIDEAALLPAVAWMAEQKLSEEDIIVIRGAKVIKRLFKVVTTSENDQLLASSARVLGKLSNAESALPAVRKRCDIREVVLAMRKFTDNPDFERFIAYTLGNVGAAAKFREEIGKEGGVQVICQILGQHIDNEDLVDNVCYALSALTEDSKTNCSFLVACRGIPLLLKCLDKHAVAPLLVDSICVIVSNLCAQGDANRDNVLKFKGAHAILDAIAANHDQGESEMLISAVRTLGQLANTPAQVSQVLKAGAVAGIKKVIASNLAEPDVIDVCLRVLVNFTADPLEENHSIVADDGGFDCILMVLKKHGATNPQLVQTSFLALVNMTVNQISCHDLIKQGHLPLLVQTVRQQMKTAAARDATTVFLSLSACSSQNEAILDSEFVNCALEILQYYREEQGADEAKDNGEAADTRVLENLCGSFRRLAVDKKQAKRIGKAGVLEAVLGLLESRPESPGVVREGFLCLAALSSSGSNAKEMAARLQDLAAKVYDGPLRQSAPVSLTAVTQCLTALYNNQPSVAEETLFDLPLVAAMLKAAADLAVGHEAFVVAVCVCLEKIASISRDLCEFVRQENAAETIHRISDNKDNWGHDDLQRAAKSLISVVTQHEGAGAGKTRRLGGRGVPKNIKRLKDEDEQQNRSFKLNKEQKNFLIAGSLVKLFPEAGGKERRAHLLLDHELQTLIIKDPRKPFEEGEKHKILRIKQAEPGRCMPALQKKSLLGKFNFKEELCFGLFGQISYACVCDTEEDRDNWVNNLNALQAYYKWRREQKKLAAEQFLKDLDE